MLLKKEKKNPIIRSQLELELNAHNLVPQLYYDKKKKDNKSNFYGCDVEPWHSLKAGRKNVPYDCGRLWQVEKKRPIIPNLIVQ